MKSLLASLFGRFSKSKNSKETSHQNRRACLLRSEPTIERPSQVLENGEEINRDGDDVYICPDVLGESSSDGKSAYRAERTKSRLEELLQGIPRIKELQWRVVAAQIQARQKMREVGFKRSAVSRADASFMKELQRLKAEGQLEAFDQLTRLADACQSARDGLGPLEDEGMEAQREFEGEMWDLRQAEDALFENFSSDPGEVFEESSVASSSSSAHNILGIPSPAIVNNPELRGKKNGDRRGKLGSPIFTTSDFERHQNCPNSLPPVNKTSRKASDLDDLQMLGNGNGCQKQHGAPICFEHSVVSSSSIPFPMQESISSQERSNEEEKDTLLLGLETQGALGHQEIHYEPMLSLEPAVIDNVDDEFQECESAVGSDSGFTNLDMVDDDYLTAVPTKRQSSTESFPKLLTNFGTRRDRINKWLLHTMLISKSEANLIGLQLQKETDSSPSPWAQLIVAFFEFDYNTSKPTDKTVSMDTRAVEGIDMHDILMTSRFNTSKNQESSGNRKQDTTSKLCPVSIPKTITENTATTPNEHLCTIKNPETHNIMANQSISEEVLSQLELPDSTSSSIDVLNHQHQPTGFKIQDTIIPRGKANLMLDELYEDSPTSKDGLQSRREREGEDGVAKDT
ncbi:hypothetical protein sscle_01g000330 [Sclerotinia sclerotiorum 1980 UF-70]|uniref:Uncharacterized protein n=1 Tax=Sclerotinia sclerotiorum (strain ATCC 18683 / 1980 / Ss-1) TaxID=665079 RepID=A0A1D9PSL5_SCLS1|nr:hypothetical protein sscle_01g000330 [Sclerotinia sclerotiorum 1980 UF-70]